MAIPVSNVNTTSSSNNYQDTTIRDIEGFNTYNHIALSFHHDFYDPGTKPERGYHDLPPISVRSYSVF